MGCTNLIRNSIPNSGGIKSKAITKPFDRLMSRGVELWNNLEITTNLTTPGTLSTVRRNIWSKILGKTCVKKLVSVAVLNSERCSKGSQCIFLNRSYTGVSTCV